MWKTGKNDASAIRNRPVLNFGTCLGSGILLFDPIGWSCSGSSKQARVTQVNMRLFSTGQWPPVFVTTEFFTFSRFREDHKDSVLGRYPPQKFSLELRKLQILILELNALLQWMLWALQIVIICAVVFGICGAVWAEGPRRLHLVISATGTTAVFCLLYTKLASISESSSQVLLQWHRCRFDRPWLLRFLWSAQPLRVLIGPCFYADSRLVLTSLGIIAEHSVPLLVSRNG